MSESRRPALRGAALLEVVIALGLLLIAMIAIGVVFRNGQYFIEKAEVRTRAMLLTEKLITTLDTGVDLDRDGFPDIDMLEREQSGSFNTTGIQESIPGMSWRIESEPSQRIDGIYELDISIYMGDPDDEEARANILRTRIVRVEPRGFDFERDFGLDETQIEDLTNLIPGGSQLFDPANFDPRVLAQLPADQLVEMLPVLLQAFGSQLGAGQIDQLLNAVNSGNLGNLQNTANQALGGSDANGAGTNNTGGQGGNRKIDSGTGGGAQ